jgi:hypothetical protein
MAPKKEARPKGTGHTLLVAAQYSQKTLKNNGLLAGWLTDFPSNHCHFGDGKPIWPHLKAGASDRRPDQHDPAGSDQQPNQDERRKAGVVVGGRERPHAENDGAKARQHQNPENDHEGRQAAQVHRQTNRRCDGFISGTGQRDFFAGGSDLDFGTSSARSWKLHLQTACLTTS